MGNSSYSLSAEEHKGMEALALAVSLAKVGVYDASMALEIHQAQAMELRRRVEGAALAEHQAEERLRGAVAFLSQTHGVPGGRLSADMERVEA